jgi:hypothetical protein
VELVSLNDGEMTLSFSVRLMSRSDVMPELKPKASADGGPAEEGFLEFLHSEGR